MRTNRVRRTYTGGKMIDLWQGNIEGKDTECPEEWIASVVEAYNPGWNAIRDEGLSLLETSNNKSIKLRELIHKDPEGILGPAHVKHFGESTGMLIKALDSAERLSFQVHPDTKSAEKIFHSPFGKTEAWYFLGDRNDSNGESCIYLGFKEGITREKWEDIFYRQDIPAMASSLHRIPVKQGDMFFVDGGVPHAIDKGCFCIEIQEPTDYTFLTDRTNTRGMVISDEMCHCGAGFPNMFDSFHYEGLTEEEVKRRWHIQPRVIQETVQIRETLLLGKPTTDKFSLHSMEIFKDYSPEPKNCFSVMIVSEGSCCIKWNGGELAVSRGQSVFIPFTAPRINIIPDKNCTILGCYPPCGVLK